MNKKIFTITVLIIAINLNSFAQLGKLKGMIGKKDSTQTEEPKDGKPKKDGGGFGAGLMNKVISKAAKFAGTIGGTASGMIGSTNDLNSVVAAPSFMSNLHPTEVQEIGQDFFNGWEPGGSAIILGFTSKGKQQFNKIEGDVLIDGKPANYVVMGFYSSFSKDNSPKKVEVSTSSGQKASFTVNPPQQTVKILSINGQKENISVDLTKDVVIELEPMKDTKTPIIVYLTGTVIGIKTLYDVGWFPAGNKITVPAASFRNMNGSQSNLGFGGCYLQVSRIVQEKATNVSGVFPEVEYANAISDGRFITVTAKPQFNKGLEVKGIEAGTNYTASKSFAMFAPAFGHMKTLGIMGFAALGKTSYYDVKTKQFQGVEITKTAKFPQFGNDVWENILDKTYNAVTQALKDEFKVTILPVEKVTNSVAYQKANSYTTEDANTTENFKIAYKSTKMFLGKRPVSELTGTKSPEHNIMKETGANALLNFTLHLDLNFESSKAIMVPRITYNIAGETLGGYYNTTYVTGEVIGASFPIKNNQTITPQMLENTVINIPALVAAFKKSIQEINAKDKANGDYEIVWKAMDTTNK